jgi:hypothetical protein
MKIYIASHCQERAKRLAAILTGQGHTITSRWINESFLSTDAYLPPRRREIAEEDIADVTSSEALILIAGPDKCPGGKFVEVGYALGYGLQVFVLGRRENMLMWHPVIEDASTHFDISAVAMDLNQ